MFSKGKTPKIAPSQMFPRVRNTPNGLAIKLFDKTMQLILLGHHRDNLDWNKIAGFQKL